jgi:HSP20 family protein
MALVRWQPFAEMESLRNQMNQLFNEMGDLSATEAQQRPARWMPAIELNESEDAFTIRAEVPGVKPEDLDIQVSRDAVSISGENRQEERSESQGVTRSEFRYGHFHRTIPLNSEIQNDRVNAEFNDGILRLVLPKAQAERDRVVKVNVNGNR